jgi:cobalamin biosynthesis protein CobT
MAGLLFDGLEQLRVELVGGRDMAGVRANLEEVFRRRTAEPGEANRRRVRIRRSPRSSSSTCASGCRATG